MESLAQFESDLWEAADNLRANSKLTSSDYFMPVLGVIFLRHAANRFDTATKQIAEDQAAGPQAPRQSLMVWVRRNTLPAPGVLDIFAPCYSANGAAHTSPGQRPRS